MTAILDDSQRRWVESTLESMSVEELAGQLLCPEDRKYSTADWLEIIKKVPIGNAFFGSKNAVELRATLEAIQDASRIPVTIAADLEKGVDIDPEYGTAFNYMMGIGATGIEQYAFDFGRAVAVEARALGIHWTFAPVIDLNLNFNNPVTGLRAFSDNPETALPLIKAMIRGRQHDNLIAATAKHFPGDGVDDRDQHLCTSVNSLPMEQWEELYGRLWRGVIDTGVMSVMSGHISLPAWQGGNADDALPATLCRKLQHGLLREKLGFNGVIVSDAAPMIGITSRVSDDDMVVENILAGSDVFLFADPVRDFERLMRAIDSGRLPVERVRESARRVLEMKAALNIHRNPVIGTDSSAVFAAHRALADEIAENGITLLKGSPAIPAKPAPGAKVLTVTLSYDNHGRKPTDLEIVDQELVKRGFQLEHLFNPKHQELAEKAAAADLVFLNFHITLHMRPGTARLTGEAIMPLWRAFYVNMGDKLICTSFGNPYTLYEQPHLPNMIITYGPQEPAQRAAVKAWLGEIPMNGHCPVRQPQVRVREFRFD